MWTMSGVKFSPINDGLSNDPLIARLREANFSPLEPSVVPGSFRYKNLLETDESIQGGEGTVADNNVPIIDTRLEAKILKKIKKKQEEEKDQ